MAGTFFLLWTDPCPARTGGLSHAHDRDCEDVHDPAHMQGQCCECGGMRFYPPAMMTADAIRQRMETLGLRPAEAVEPEEAPSEDIKAPIDRDEHLDHEFVEPKMAQGTFPPGNRLGWGRGEATPRFLARVEAYVGWRKFLAERGEAEHE